MPELRREPIVGRWIIFSTNRNKRPTDFKKSSLKSNDEVCPFCEGNEAQTPPEVFALRKNHSAKDSPGWTIRVVPNKFPAVKESSENQLSALNFYNIMNAKGNHEVIIETPDHNRKMCSYTKNELNNILDTYKKRFLVLNNKKDTKYLLLFKNEGPLAGASLSHPHTQLISLPLIPNRVNDEVTTAFNYYNKNHRCAYCDMIEAELTITERVIYENKYFVAFCPYASRFPYEIWISPKKHNPFFENISFNEIKYLSDNLSCILKKIDLGLNQPQYNLIIKTAPVTLNNHINSFFHWHIEIIPRFNRMAGFECGTGYYINQTLPEHCAEVLRDTNINCTEFLNKTN